MSNKLTALALVSAIAIGWIACGPSPEERKAKEKADKIAAAQAAMAAARPPLLAKRQELNAARAALGNSKAPDKLAKVEALERETGLMADKFTSAISAYINASEIKDPAAVTPEQRKALDELAEEQMMVAAEVIEAGEYQTAIQIYKELLYNDPTNAKVDAAKTEAERLQYMTPERFAKVKPDMTQDEVLKLLGHVREANTTLFKEQGRLGWFYAKKEGGFASVYFKEKTPGQGDWVVESVVFDAPQ